MVDGLWSIFLVQCLVKVRGQGLGLGIKVEGLGFDHACEGHARQETADGAATISE